VILLRLHVDGAVLFSLDELKNNVYPLVGSVLVYKEGFKLESPIFPLN